MVLSGTMEHGHLVVNFRHPVTSLVTALEGHMLRTCPQGIVHSVQMHHSFRRNDGKNENRSNRNGTTLLALLCNVPTLPPQETNQRPGNL